MSLPRRIAAYDDCFDIYEKAAASTTGVRVAFSSYADARYFVTRMHTARSLQREESRRVYQPEDKRYDKSENDKYLIKYPVADDNGEWWVYVKPISASILAVETLDAPGNTP
jgi:hypothetical protein